MKRLILTILTGLCISLLVYAQSSERPVTSQPTSRGSNLTNPRPTPPSCCRPFRTTTDGELISIMRNGSPTGSGEPLPPSAEDKLKDAERYRESLEEFRKATEALRKDDKISKEEYKKTMSMYRIRLLQYKIKVESIENNVTVQ